MDALELAAVAVWAFAVAVAGGLVGMVLGNLRLPVVLLFASSPAAGAGANVAISGLSALTSASAHARAGRVDWRLFAWMAPPSLAGGLAGGLVSGVLPGRALLGIIAVVVLYGALEIMRHRRARGTRPTGRLDGGRGPIVGAALIGFSVGVIGGVVGLILGTLRLPAMVKWLGTSAYAAVGTNAAVGVVVGIGGLVGHIPEGVDWAILAVGAAAGMPGAYLGSRLTGRLDEDTLLAAIAAVLVVSGLSMGIRALAG